MAEQHNILIQGGVEQKRSLVNYADSLKNLILRQAPDIVTRQLDGAAIIIIVF